MTGVGSLTSFSSAGGMNPRPRSRLEGSILLPCLLLLSLISLTALGFLSLTSTEILISSTMDDGHQAKLTAYSGKEVALLMLKSDVKYTGGSGLVFPDGDGSVNITMASPAPFKRDITSIGYCGKAHTQIDVKTRVYPRHFGFTLAVAADFEMRQNSKILGDLFVTGYIKGDTTALITGDVYLKGNRSILTDVNGKVITIDGQTVPTIDGGAFDNQKPLTSVGWALAALKATAQGQGQYYTKNQTFYNKTFTGVVYVSAGKDVEFYNVIIKGVFVSEPPGGFNSVLNSSGDAANTLTVKGGYFLKVVSEPTVLEDVAIIAPASTLKVEGGSCLDALGGVVIGYGEFSSGSDAVITGSTVVGGGVICDGDFVFQSPSSMRDSDPNAVIFKEYEVTETEYTEQ